jgi:hypothetical protein
MVVSGAVALSVTPEFQTSPALQGVAPLFGGSIGGVFGRAPAMNRDTLKQAIQVVLENSDAAASITASPTSKGFKGVL